MHKIFLKINIVFIVCSFIAACTSDKNPNAPKDLKQASAVIKQMSSKRRLSRTHFVVINPKTPTKFVGYMFSALGSADWPPYDTSSLDEIEQAKAIGDILIPSSVELVAFKMDPKKSKQLVIIPDDKNWLIRVDGYVDVKKPPVLKLEWPFPRF